MQGGEERYRTLFETLPHGIIHYERDGSVIRMNPAAMEITGLALDQMTAADRAAWLLHEDGTPYEPEDLPAKVALRTGDVVAGVVASVHNPRIGEVRWLRITAVPDAWDAQGRPRRAYSVITDITEQHTAQARLRESNRLLGRCGTQTSSASWWPTEKRVQEANDAFLDMIGYTRPDLAAGRITWDAITPPEWVASSTKPWSSCAVPAPASRMTRSSCITTGTACPS